MLRRFEQVVRPLVRAFSGRVVKTMGDAFLLTFPSPTDALHCAMAIHDRLDEEQRDIVEADRFEVRCAVNVGEVRVDRGDIFGEPVNIAARIESVAAAGEVVFSEAAYLAMTRSEVPSEEMGAHDLKGIPEPVRLYRVPRVEEVGAYEITGDGAPREPEAAPHPLAPGTLPFGGLALARVRDRLGGGAGITGERLVSTAQTAGTAVKGWWGTLMERQLRPGAARFMVHWRGSKRFRVVVIGICVALIAGTTLLAWPGGVWKKKVKPRKLTPIEKIQRIFD